MFVNDTTVSKGMVKYAQQLSRESVLDISGPVSIPEKPVEKCTQKEVRPAKRSMRCLLCCMLSYSKVHQAFL